MATRQNKLPLEVALLRKVLRLAPQVVSEKQVSPLVARALLEKAPKLALLAARYAMEAERRPPFTDDAIRRALAEHAAKLEVLAMERSDLSQYQLLVHLVSWRPYCDEAPVLFPPFCRVRRH